MKLVDKFRPRSLADVVGQDAAVRQVRAILERGGAGGRAFWITGPSGTGKTTLARIIAADVASDFGTREIEAGSLTPAKVRELEADYSRRCMFSNGWAVVVNECHGLRRDTVRLLLDALERLPDYVTWVFTTTNTGQQSFFEDDSAGDAAPLVSRCVEVQLKRADAAFAARAREIAVAEGIDGFSPDVYTAACVAVQGNMRRLLQRIEAGQLEATAGGAMPVAAAPSKPKKLAALPSEAELRALTAERLRAMCVERGAASGWAATASASAAVAWLLKRG